MGLRRVKELSWTSGANRSSTFPLSSSCCSRCSASCTPCANGCLPDDIDRVLVWSLAFVPARYDTSALTDGILPGGWGAEIWSFFTYALLHADWMHLGFNAVWLLAFASPVARRFGAGAFCCSLQRRLPPARWPICSRTPARWRR